MEDYLSKLNEQQRAAVEYCSGPQLVIAGAGSGKTRVLTYKIVHMLAHGFEPWRILALTFTNKAAREMRERIETLVGPKIASRLWMGTFHSIFARILRANAERIGFKPNFTIYDTSDSKSLVKMIIKDMDLDEKVYKPSTVLNAISRAKNHLVGPQEYAADYQIQEADRRAKMGRMAEVYAGYVNRCHVAGAMDFDDLLFYTFRLFDENPDVRRHYQEFFRYVLVDEYQDTNYAQHRIVEQLTTETQALCVVGDDAQSIYSFRGANIGNILHLNKAYPNLQTFKLEQNYRSTQNIVEAANSLIDKNKDQLKKKVFSRNSQGDRIEVQKSYSGYEEGGLVANRILQLQMKTGDSFEEFAILYRTNAQSRDLEESLRKRNIPYRIYGGLSFYQRKEVKDAIAYFRLSVNPNDDEAIKRVINYPARGIGDTTLKKLTAAAIDRRVSIWAVICDPARYDVDLGKAALTKLAEFRRMIISFNHCNGIGDGLEASEKMNAEEVARKIITDTRLLAVLISDRTPESISKQENLQELLNGVKEFVVDKIEEGNTESISMSDFLGEVSLATDQDTQDEDKSEKVTLMTIHAAKGLEFGNVFIVGVEDDLLPSAMSKDNPWEVEEERRLLYVAITRAKRFCMMTYTSHRFRNGMQINPNPSPFLHDIDASLLNFTMGSTLPQASAPAQKPWLKRPTITPPPAPRPATSRPYESPAQAAKGGSPTALGDFSMHTPGELSEGMRIEHNRFGLGNIIDIDTSQADARIRVKFDNVEVKTLLLKFAKFKILQ